jgi:adenylate cyclase
MKGRVAGRETPVLVLRHETGFDEPMAIEVERKFLVRNDEWQALSTATSRFRQFYLAGADDRTVRVRVVDESRAVLTLKFGTSVAIRNEYEFPIPIGDAMDMQRFALGTVLAKRRHLVPYGPHVYEVDVFEGELKGLVLAELESPDALTVSDLPGWLGREVTGQSAYFNASLALKGLPEPA